MSDWVEWLRASRVEARVSSVYASSAEVGCEARDCSLCNFMYVFMRLPTVFNFVSGAFFW